MESPTLRSSWLRRREALHEAFLELAGPVDASYLAYLGQRRRSFTEAEVVDLWRAQAANPGTDPANHLYVHVPFCKSICSFCNYERLRPGRVEVMQVWTEHIVRSIERLGAATAGLAFHNLYFGGGTPSVLTHDLLARVLGAIDAHFTFHPWAHRHFELDPAIIDGPKLALLRRHGFDHLSFGIQTLDAEANALHHRGRQDRGLVFRRLDEFADAGVQRVSCDLLLGLVGTTPAQLVDDLDQLLSHPSPPDHVDVFFLIPTASYLAEHFGGDRDAFESHLAPFRDLAGTEVPRLAAAHGYRIGGGKGHGYSLRRVRAAEAPSPEQEVPGYTQHTWLQGRPVNLLGIGTSARSHLFGRAQLEYQPPDGDPGADGEPTYEGRHMELADEARSYAIFQLRTSDRLDREAFLRILGRQPEELLPETLAAWRALGLLRDGPDPTLEPQEPEERKRALLWAVPEQGLEDVVARHLGLHLDPGALEHLLGLGPGSPVGHGRVVRHEHGRTVLALPAGELRIRWAPRARSRSEPLAVGAVLERAPATGLHTDDAKIVRALERLLNDRLGQR